MDIMTQLLERNNIDVLDLARKEGRENYVDPQGHYHTMQFKGNDCHDLFAIKNYFIYIYDFDTPSDISES